MHYQKGNLALKIETYHFAFFDPLKMDNSMTPEQVKWINTSANLSNKLITLLQGWKTHSKNSILFLHLLSSNSLCLTLQAHHSNELL